MTDMTDDPIVAETRERRQEMMDEAGNDLDSLFAYIQREQSKYKDRLVRLPAKPAVPLGTRKPS